MSYGIYPNATPEFRNIQKSDGTIEMQVRYVHKFARHSHGYAHATMCNAGSCLVSLEGRSYTIDKNSQPLNLPAGEWHEIEALEDNTVFVNVFAEGKY